jgi:hypothetical protein
MAVAGNLRSALFDNVRTRPAVIGNYRLDEYRGIPSFRHPLERSLKPLPTLPPIVGNTTYDPTRFTTKPYESIGSSHLRNLMLMKRNFLPSFTMPVGEPSKTNPTVL